MAAIVCVPERKVAGRDSCSEGVLLEKEKNKNSIFSVMIMDACQAGPNNALDMRMLF